jgi:hypothetical protein
MTKVYLTMDEAMEQEYREEHEYEIMFNKDSSYMKRIGRGAYNKASANGKTSGKKVTLEDFMQSRGLKEVKNLFYRVEIKKNDKTLIIEGKEYFDARCTAYAKLNAKGKKLREEFLAQA